MIGSSRARVIGRDHLAAPIAVTARSQATLDTMTDLGLADSTSLDAAEAARDADLVVLCTPLSAYESVARTIAPAFAFWPWRTGARGARFSHAGNAKNQYDGRNKQEPTHKNSLTNCRTRGVRNFEPLKGKGNIMRSLFRIRVASEPCPYPNPAQLGP